MIQGLGILQEGFSQFFPGASDHSAFTRRKQRRKIGCKANAAKNQPLNPVRYMFHAWIIWLLSALFMCYKYAIEVSPSIMTPELMRAFSLTGTQMGNLAAAYFYAYLIMQIPAGILIDRWGPQRITSTAIALCGLGALIFSRADSTWIACLGRFISGVGGAFAAVSCLKLITTWFPSTKFAFMAGLMMSVGMLGAVGGQGPLSVFVQSLEWRTAMQIISGGGFLLAVVFALIVRDKAPHHHAPATSSKSFNIFKSLKSILRNRQSWYLSFYSGFAFAPVSTFGGLWGVPYLTQAHAVNPHAAAQASSLIFLGFALGCPLFGWFSDYIKKRRAVMFWGTFLAAICLTCVIYLPSLPFSLIAIGLFFFGFFISSFLLCFTMIKELQYVSLAATSIGFMNAFDALFGAFSDPLTGKILDSNWTGAVNDGARVFSISAYHIALGILIVYLVLSLFLIKFIRETNCKQVCPTGMP